MDIRKERESLEKAQNDVKNGKVKVKEQVNLVYVVTTQAIKDRDKAKKNYDKTLAEPNATPEQKQEAKDKLDEANDRVKMWQREERNLLKLIGLILTAIGIIVSIIAFFV